VDANLASACPMVVAEMPNSFDRVPERETSVRSARVFVALRIAPELARALARLGKGLEKFSVRLVPPWSDVSVADAVAKLRRVAETCAAFTLKFCHIGYGPEPRRPRFLWAECEASNELVELVAALLRTFAQTDERSFRPHVTLARLRNTGRAIARKYSVDQDIAFTQRVSSVELMQSPAPGESGYKVLASQSLAENRELPSGA
jgi:RNA 2',3'-cyclic 3'-phosphodiesterase